MLSASCADTAHLVKQASILTIVAKQQWGGPCYFTHRFSSILATVLNQCIKYFDINYFWSPMVSKQLVFTLFILLFYFYPIYLILLLFSLNLCLRFVNSCLENIFGLILIFSSKKLFAMCITKARIAIITCNYTIHVFNSCMGVVSNLTLIL